MTVSRPQSAGSLTASGERITAKRAEQLARLTSAWQKRAFLYYDALGEIKYAAQFYARLSNLELFAARWETNEKGERELVPADDPKAIEALARVKDPGGGSSRSNLLASYGRLMFLVGECVLFYTVDKEGGERWEVLSTSEVRTNPLGTEGGRASHQRIKAPSLSPEEYRDPGEDDWSDITGLKEAMAYRFWRRHPQYSEWPDSPMRGVLEICEQLLMLDRAARGRSLSRIAGNGILLVDSRISDPPPEPEPDEDIETDPLLADLTAMITAAMQDDSAIELVVPLLARIDVPPAGIGETQLTVKDMFHHLKLTDPGEFYPEAEQIEKVIHRLALGLDLPPEALEGKGGANHWGGWEIDADLWEHLEPYAQGFCDDLTSGYYLPTLREGKVENWQDYAVAYDPASLRREPERSKDSKDLHKEGVLSDMALRTANGFTEEDAPSEEERRIWISRFSRDPAWALGEEPSARELLPPAAEEDDAAAGKPAGSPQDVEPGAPENDTGGADDDVEKALAGSMVEAQVLAALEMAVARGRELASNRVVTRAKRDQGAAALLAERPGAHAPFVLGREQTRSVSGLVEAKLVEGIRSPLTTPLTRWGLTPEQVGLILTAVEQHAAVTLYEERQRPFPPQFRNYVRGIIRNGTNGQHG